MYIAIDAKIPSSSESGVESVVVHVVIVVCSIGDIVVLGGEVYLPVRIDLECIINNCLDHKLMFLV